MRKYLLPWAVSDNLKSDPLLGFYDIIFLLFSIFFNYLDIFCIILKSSHQATISSENQYLNLFSSC